MTRRWSSTLRMLRRCSWRLTRRSVAEGKDRQPAIPKGLPGEGPATAVSTRLSGFRKACFARWIMITCLLALCSPLLTAEFLSSLVGLLWQSNGYFGAVRACSNRTNLAPSSRDIEPVIQACPCGRSVFLVRSEQNSWMPQPRLWPFPIRSSSIPCGSLVCNSYTSLGTQSCSRS